MHKATFVNSSYFCLIAYVFVMSRGHNSRDVKRLKSQLFENYSYDKFIRLVRNQSNVIDVSHHIQVVVTLYSQSAFNELRSLRV